MYICKHIYTLHARMRTTFQVHSFVSARDRQKQTKTDKPQDRHAHISRQADKNTQRQTDRQTDRQTRLRTDMPMLISRGHERTF